MGFLVYNIKPLEDGRVGLRQVAPLVFGSETGLFAKHLPAIAAKGEKWNLSAQALLALAGFDGGPTQAILFDLTPRSSDRVDLYELVEVSGRTVSLITDALFHFKVACSGRRKEFAVGADGELAVPAWQERPNRYEQLRLEGGVKGGNWAWSEPPQSMSATIL